MRKLKGRIAIVTGSGRGVGRAIARKPAQDGARRRAPPDATPRRRSVNGGACAGSREGDPFSRQSIGE
jgi:NAD(P)-dependent dehydrogenase (short-subunit alcohol dehydrogenase family)